MKIFIVFSLFTITVFSSEYDAMTKACNNGVATACYELGSIFSENHKQAKTVAAQNYFEKACAYGFDVACKQLSLSDINTSE